MVRREFALASEWQAFSQNVSEELSPKPSRCAARSSIMPKTLDTIEEAIRNPKHPFRQVDSQPDKAHKHRYERRKIKEYMRLGDWESDMAADRGLAH